MGVAFTNLACHPAPKSQREDPMKRVFYPLALAAASAACSSSSSSPVGEDGGEDASVDGGGPETGAGEATVDSTVPADSGQDARGTADAGVDAPLETGMDAPVDAPVDAAADAPVPCSDGGIEAGIVCASGCVDTMTDPNNCGGCNVVCPQQDAGGSCSGGVCRATALLQTVAPVGFNIAADNSYVYWSGNAGAGDLFELPVDGGPAKSLSSQGTGVVTVESGIVYWLIGSGVWAVSATDGGPATEIASNDNCCREDVVASNGVLYFGGTNGAISSVPATGGTIMPIYTGSPPSAYIAAGNARVYWTDGTTNVAAVGQDGGGFALLAGGQNNPTFLAVDATNLYWVENENPGRIMKLALGADAGSAIALATGQDQPNGIAIDSTSVYWLSGNDGGSVWKVPIAGGSPVELVTGQSALAGGGNGFGPIAVDDTSVYWGNGNALMRLTPK
jgi:hypothetical protein